MDQKFCAIHSRAFIHAMETIDYRGNHVGLEHGVKIVDHLIGKGPQRMYIRVPEFFGEKEKINFVNEQVQPGPYQDAYIEIRFTYAINREFNGMSAMIYSFQDQDSFNLARCLLAGMQRYLPFNIQHLYTTRENDGIYCRQLAFFHELATPAAVILDVLFLSNWLEAAYIQLPNAHSVIARAIQEGYCDFTGMYLDR